MKQFLAVFTGTPQSPGMAVWNALPAAERQARERAGMEAWHRWMATHQDRIVVAGGPLGKTLLVSAAGVTETRNALCGYVVVSAASHDEAARLFEQHPHFAIFPGEAVEVLEVLPVPGS